MPSAFGVGTLPTDAHEGRVLRTVVLYPVEGVPTLITPITSRAKGTGTGLLELEWLSRFLKSVHLGQSRCKATARAGGYCRPIGVLAFGNRVPKTVNFNSQSRGC
jgi:hypothetical protein